MGRQHLTYISTKLKEDLIVMVTPENRVGSQSLEEHLMHGDSLLEVGQVLTAQTRVSVVESGKGKVSNSEVW